MSDPSPPGAFLIGPRSVGRGRPRWSAVAPKDLPLSTAGLFSSRAWVGVGPPLSARSGSSKGSSTPGRERLAVERLQVRSEERVYPPSETVPPPIEDRKSTRLNSSHANISYAVFCLKKKK